MKKRQILISCVLLSALSAVANADDRKAIDLQTFNPDQILEDNELLDVTQENAFTDDLTELELSKILLAKKLYTIGFYNQESAKIFVEEISNTEINKLLGTLLKINPRNPIKKTDGGTIGY